MNMVATIDTSGMRKALTRYAKESGKTLGEAVLQGSRLVAGQLAYFTQPYGMEENDKNSGKLQGENAVGNELGRVYKHRSKFLSDLKKANFPKGKTRSQTPEALSKQVYKLMVKRKYDQANDIMNKYPGLPYRGHPRIGAFDAGYIHHRADIRHGPRKKISRNQFPQLINNDEKPLNKYVEKIKARVGMAKAGWVACMQQLGGIGRARVAKPRPWVTRHSRKARMGRVDNNSHDPVNPSVTIENLVPWVGKNLSEDQANDAFDKAQENMVKMMQIFHARRK